MKIKSFWILLVVSALLNHRRAIPQEAKPFE